MLIKTNDKITLMGIYLKAYINVYGKAPKGEDLETKTISQLKEMCAPLLYKDYCKYQDIVSKELATTFPDYIRSEYEEKGKEFYYYLPTERRYYV